MPKIIATRIRNSRSHHQHNVVYEVKLQPDDLKLLCKIESDRQRQDTKKLFDWIKSLTIEQRLSKFTFKNKTFVTLLIEMCYRRTNFNETYFNIHQETRKRTLVLTGSYEGEQRQNFEQLQAQQDAINNILISSEQSYNDCVRLSRKLWQNVQDVWNFFTKCLKSIPFYVSNDQYKKIEKLSNQIYFVKKNDKSCLNYPIRQWICRVLRYKIWSEYYSKDITKSNQSQLQQIKCNNISRCWNQLSLSKKKNILRIPTQKVVLQKINQLNNDPRINIQTLHNIKVLKQAQINQYVKKLNLLESTQIQKYLTQFSMEDALKIQNNLCWIIYKQIQGKLLQDGQTQIKKKKKNKNKKKKLKYKNVELKNEQSIEGISTKNKVIQKNQTDQTDTNIQTQNSVKPQLCQNIKEIGQDILISQKQMKQIIQEKLLKNKQILLNLYNRKLESDINQLVNEISIPNNKSRNQKYIAFKAVRYLLNLHSYDIKIFGSFATGLDLQNSDIDIVLITDYLSNYTYGLQLNREYICYILQLIHNVMSKQNWIQNIIYIPTAAIPILKFQINLKRLQENPYYGNIALFEQIDQKNIKFDLTASMYENGSNVHFGQRSTAFIKEWLYQYPSLYKICMLLKLFLKNKGLDNSYSGGLNHFSITLMIVAYLRHKKLCKQSNIAEVFYGFLDFYIYEFNNSEIDSQFPFFVVQYSNRTIQIKSPFNSKIITKNAYQYKNIIQQFRNLNFIKHKTQCVISHFQNLQTIPEYEQIFKVNYLADYFNDQY